MFKNFLKSVSVLFLALTLIFTFAGCGLSTSKNSSNNDSELSGFIQIAGSTSVQPLSEELAMEFMKRHPKVKISVAGGGSGAGIKAAQEGTADIGASSRELKPEEKTVEEFIIAKDAIAVIVNPQNPINNLTLEQIKSIFSGEVTNWKQVGGKDEHITVVVREEGSGTRGAFEEIVMGEEKFIESAIIQNTTGGVRTAVSEVQNAIGFISLGALRDDVKALKVNGISVSKDNVINNRYKVARPFIYMTKGEPEGVVKSYLTFVLGEGQDIVSKEFIPVR